jgi:hypothetical protein
MPSGAGAVVTSVAMAEDHLATAQGDLGRTPLGHLFVYAIDRRISGAFYFREPSGIEHVVQIARGAPVKIRPGDTYARLGELLVAAGALSQATVDDALATQGLLGDVLVLAGRVDRDVLESEAEKQFLRRIVRLFSMPKETTFRYCEGDNELLEYGGEPASIDPLLLLWAGMRAHGEASAMLDGTLALLGDAAMRLHPMATVGRFRLTEAEARVIEALFTGPLPMSRLLDAAYVPESTLRKLCYTLLITRQIDLGTGTLPVGVHDVARTPPAGMAMVARMQLRPTVHRVGAAAPDPAGDGERVTATYRRLADPRLADGLLPVRPAADVPPRSTPLVPPSTVIVTKLLPSADAALEEPGGSAIEDPRSTLKSAATQAFIGRGIEDDLAASGVENDRGPQGENQRPSSAESASVASEVRPAMSVRVRGNANPVSRTVGQVTVLSAPTLFQLAVNHLAERDLVGALDACTMARKAAPGEPDYIALSAWIRYQMPGADIKALAVELDEVLSANEAHVQARYYRAVLRRRLGDDLGAIRDLRRVIEVFPTHSEASRELAALDPRRPKERAGLFGRLFKR